MDKLKHFILCFLVTISFGWTYGLTVGLAIEMTQAETGNATPKKFLKKLFSKDTLLDLVADGLGIVAGIFIRRLICGR